MGWHFTGLLSEDVILLLELAALALIVALIFAYVYQQVEYVVLNPGSFNYSGGG